MRMKRSTSRVARRTIRLLALILGAAWLTASCGSTTDEIFSKAFHEGRGDVPGSFLLRLNQNWRDKLDSVQSQVSTLASTGDNPLTSRFTDETEFGLTSSTKLSDLLKLSIPDIKSQFINQQLFTQLQDLKGSDGQAFFDRVDTEKYIGGELLYDTSSIDDPLYSEEYFLEMIRWEEAVASITDTLAGSSKQVVVAVVDTGVESDHEDLSSVMWTSPDDSSVNGYDAIEEQEVTASDRNGHGTHVAGTIAAVGINAKGIHGIGSVTATVDSETRSVTEVMSIKVLSDDGGGSSDSLTKGIKWAVDQHRAEKAGDKMILNMSLGGPFDIDGYNYQKDDAGNPILRDDVFEYAAANDILTIVAAGNESCQIGSECDLHGREYKETYYYPCSYQNVLCVAASTHEEKLAGFSNRRASVGITAPGFRIISTVPDGKGTVEGDKYAYYSGTSMATPVTAGAASLLWAHYPDFTAPQIKLILQKSAAQIDDIKNEVSSGDGRLDLKAAFDYAAELTAAGKGPADMDPTTVASEAVTPESTPDTSQEDPNAASPASGEGTSGVSSETETTQDCGTLGGVSMGSSLGWFLLLPCFFVGMLRRG